MHDIISKRASITLCIPLLCVFDLKIESAVFTSLSIFSSVSTFLFVFGHLSSGTRNDSAELLVRLSEIHILVFVTLPFSIDPLSSVDKKRISMT